jgi:putative oxidoreductase
MTTKENNKTLHIGLWVLQVFLGLAMIMAGFMKLTAPLEELLSKGMTFVQEYQPRSVRFIGVSEVLGGLGLILPSAFRIKPILTPIAAMGIAIIMLLATIYHITHEEPTVPSVVLFLLAVFIAWGRFKKAPIAAK